MNNDELLKLNEEKNKILVKMNFLLEGLKDVYDEEEKNTTLELINKLQLRLDSVNKQIESGNLNYQDINEEVEDTTTQSIEQEKDSQEFQEQDESEQVDYEKKGTEQEDSENTPDENTYEEQETQEEDIENPKIYVGRKDNGNILAYYHRTKKQGK